MRNMLGDSVAEVDDGVKDAVGEMTNMISGAARRRLAEQGLTLSAGLPTVVSGRDHTIQHVVDGPVLVIPFENDQGSLVVEVALCH
jgi:chemotaxis protein CheX